jgi:hypothetical protein
MTHTSAFNPIIAAAAVFVAAFPPAESGGTELSREQERDFFSRSFRSAQFMRAGQLREQQAPGTGTRAPRPPSAGWQLMEIVYEDFTLRWANLTCESRQQNNRSISLVGLHVSLSHTKV